MPHARRLAAYAAQGRRRGAAHQTNGCVVECIDYLSHGRDIGTTVFPDAELKIFVNAPAQTRAQRRFKEMVEKGIPATFEEVLANVAHRDHIDETRRESPLRRADDAIDLDNSDMTIDQQNQWLLDRAMEAINKKASLLNDC